MSSSTPYHIFTVAGAIEGAGNDGPGASLGSQIVQALLKDGAQVRVLVRASPVRLVPVIHTCRVICR